MREGVLGPLVLFQDTFAETRAAKNISEWGDHMDDVEPPALKEIMQRSRKPIRCTIIDFLLSFYVDESFHFAQGCIVRNPAAMWLTRF